MKHTVLLATFILVLGISVASSNAYAVCSGGSVGGFTQYLSGQIPDVVLISGVASKKEIIPYYVSFASTGGHCGIFAKSTVPGTTITATYGCSGPTCVARPAGQFAAVGSAYGVPFNIVAPNRTAGANNTIRLAFDGSAAAGTQGFIELAYAANDFGDLSTAFVFARIPIYVETSTPALGWSRVVSTASSVSGSRLILSHPHLDSKPSARLFVSHVNNPTGGSAGTSWDHRVFVEYDATLGKWAIRNADNAMMPAGLGFNLRIDPTATTVCVPPPTTGSEFTSMLVVDDYNANGNIWATLIVTPLTGPNHPVAVKYEAPHWGIVYSDGATLPGGACFNVKVIAFSQYLDDPAQPDLSGKSNTIVNSGVGVDMRPNGTVHTVGGIRMLPFVWSRGSTGLRMVHTSNLTPAGRRPPASPDTKSSSLWISPLCITINCVYPSRRWGVRHEDGTAVPGVYRANVWAEYQSCYPGRATDTRFAWDPVAARANMRNSRVTFERAQSVFSDSSGVVLSDPDQLAGGHSVDLLGVPSGSRLPLVVRAFCDMDGTIRLLSARQASPRERNLYRKLRER